MTSDTWKHIELTDILALRFECKECGSVLSVPLEKYSEWALRYNAHRDRVKPPLSECPVCGDPWAFVDGSDHCTPVTLFVERLNELVGVLQKKERAPGFSMTLEIKGQKQSEGKVESENEHAV